MRVFLIAMLTAAACSAPATSSNTTKSAAPATPAPAAEAAPAAVNAKQYGGALGKSAPVELVKVLDHPEQYAGQTVLTSGTVRAACTNKGCWMELAGSKDPAAPGCRVTFKDYGFFVPTTSAGKLARVEATVQVKTIAKGEVEHMESEGGTVKNKQPDGSAREIRLIATGVELSDG